MKIQFGCGENRLDGWVNYDNDLDVTKLPLPFADNSAEMIFAEHLIEHLSGPELLRFLDECLRILKPTGTLRLCWPDIDYGITQDHGRDLIVNHGHKQVLSFHCVRLFCFISGFTCVEKDCRSEIDGHWKIIGREKDDLETTRIVATK